MNKPVTALAVGVGASNLVPQVQECVADVFAWCGVTAVHPQSWALLLMAGLAFLLHHLKKGTPDA